MGKDHEPAERRQWVYGFLFFVVAALLLVIIAAAIYIVGRTVGLAECHACSDAEKSKAIAEARTIGIQIFAGLGAAGALFFTYLNYIRSTAEARESQRLARESYDSSAAEARESQRLARESRTSENFVKAVEQLGNREIPVRVGGLAGLGRLLRFATPDDDYWPLMDVLAAFVRDRAVKFARDRDQQTSEPPELAEDIQFALNVLARRSATADAIYRPDKRKDAAIDFYKTNLSNAWMAGGHFEWSHFREIVLINADLAKALLIETNLIDANLTGANLNGAILTGADLTGADITGADLRNAQVTKGQLAVTKGKPANS